MDNRVMIVGEISANHGGNIEIAKKTIKMAKDCGADAVKIQTYTPDTITIDCDNDYFQVKQGTIWDGVTLYELYKTAYTPYEWHEELFSFAKKIDIPLFSTPFDFTAVDLLEKLDNPIYKIASFEINDIPLIKYAAKKGKPMILSTGVATFSDIEEAVNTCKSVGNNDITLLKCTSAYPASPSEINLKTMISLKDTFNVKVGISDHTLTNTVSVAAAALGATIIERHIILDKALGGPDSSFSLDEANFRSLIEEVRTVENALGSVTYDLTEKQLKSKEHSRSLFIIKDVKQGDTVTADNVRSIRPYFGMHTRYYDEILGKTFTMDLEKGTPLTFTHIS